MYFDATSLHLSAIWDEKPVYPKLGTGFAFNSHMNVFCVDSFNSQTFVENAILEIKF